MANHKSSKQRIVRNAKRNVINTNRTSRMRTAIKKVETAIGSGDEAAAKAALKAAQPELARGANKAVISKKAASRKLSRLSSQIKKLSKKA